MMKKHKNTLYFLVIIAIVTIPLFIFKNADFTGSDDKAVGMIQAIDKNYQPWFNGFTLFRSAEIISTFFAIQAAIGAGVLGYYIGYSRGEKKNNKS